LSSQREFALKKVKIALASLKKVRAVSND